MKRALFLGLLASSLMLGCATSGDSHPAEDDDLYEADDGDGAATAVLPDGALAFSDGGRRRRRVNQDGLGELDPPLLAGGADGNKDLLTLRLRPRDEKDDKKGSKKGGGIVGSLFQAYKAYGIFKEVAEWTGLDKILFGEGDKADVSARHETANALRLIKESLEANAKALQTTKDDLMVGLGKLMIDRERTELAAAMAVNASRIAASDTSPMVLGYFASENVSEADKHANARYFVRANPGDRLQADIEKLHAKYDAEGYLAKLARVYALSAASKSTTAAASDAFERLEQDYMMLALHECNLILTFAASKTLTGVTDSTDPAQIAKAAKEAAAARGDLQHFLPIWVARAKEHQTAYLRAVAMMAGILGSTYELNTWRDATPSPISLFGTDLARAADVSEAVLRLYDPKSARLHKLILARAVDAAALKPKSVFVRTIDAKDCLTLQGGGCLRGFKNTVKSEVVSFDVDTQDTGNYAYFYTQGNDVHLTKSGKWVVFDIQFAETKEGGFYQISYDSVALGPGRTTVAPALYMYGSAEQATAAVDARYLGPSARFDKLPIRRENHQYKNSWGRFTADLTPGTVSLKTQGEAGGPTAGADNYGRMDVVVDQSISGSMWNSWRSEIHHVGFEQGNSHWSNHLLGDRNPNTWFNDCDVTNDAKEWVTTTHIARIANASLIDIDDREQAVNAACTKNNDTADNRLPSSEQMFDEEFRSKKYSANDSVRSWTPRETRVSLPSGKQQFLIQAGYNVKDVGRVAQRLHTYANFLELAVGIGGVNFYISGTL